MKDYHNWSVEREGNGRTFTTMEALFLFSGGTDHDGDGDGDGSELASATSSDHFGMWQETEIQTQTEIQKETEHQSQHQHQHQHSVITNGHKHEQETKVKIVAFSDLTYAPVAKWWYQRMTNLSYTTHTLVLIDNPAVQHFTNINNSNNNNSTNLNININDNFYRFETQIVDDGKRRKNKVRSLWYNRILYCLNQLKAGQSLLLTDVDNIFATYEPLAPFYDSGYDAIFALETKFPTYIFDTMGFVLCGGMTFLKSTNATVAVMEKLLDMCDTPEHPQRCDDQVEWNQMLAADMVWNSTWSREESRLTDGGMVQFGFDGVNKAIPGFRAKVWDRDFAWRGAFSTDIKCPSLENWVAMPHSLPDWIKKDLKEFHSRIAGDVSVEKMARVQIWDAFCGKHGTHRTGVVKKVGRDGNDEDVTNSAAAAAAADGARDTLNEALKIYKATL